MPKTKSAKKALRQAKRRQLQNLKVKDILRITLKKTNPSNLPKTFSKIDKAAKRAIISPNKAAKLKSKLSQKFSKVKTPQTSKKGK